MNTLQLRRILLAFLLLPAFQANATNVRRTFNFLNAYAQAYNFVVSVHSCMLKKVQYFYKSHETTIERLRQQAKTKGFQIAVAAGTAGTLLTIGIVDAFYRNRIAGEFNSFYGNHPYSHSTKAALVQAYHAADKRNLTGASKDKFIAQYMVRYPKALNEIKAPHESLKILIQARLLENTSLLGLMA